MLGLRLPTDPRWVDIASRNIEEILTDHAYCEQKAASTAISLIVSFPEFPELVSEMTELAREEMSHFGQVHKRIIERGLQLGRERKDEYVARIQQFFPKTADRRTRLIQRLLIAALIEARSCERFKVLSENIQDEDLSRFYRGLMASEAGHYKTFLTLARKYGRREEVDSLWQSLLDYEAEVIRDFGKKEFIHG
ncbi:MAG: tRNA-(ms[2]io[6]A)-hydroxylase [Thermaurantimonas sp.]